MNKYLACFALSALYVALIAQSMTIPEPSVGAELSPEEFAAANEMSQVSVMPEKDEEYKNNKVPEFNGFCIEVHEYVFTKFQQVQQGTKLAAWQKVFNALAPSATSAAELQNLIRSEFQTSINKRFNVPDEVRGEETEVKFTDEQLQQAIERLNEENEGKGVVSRIVSYIRVGVSTLLSNIKDQMQAQMENLKASARDYEMMIGKIEEACDVFKDNLSKPVNNMFSAYKQKMLKQPNSEHLRSITQKEVKCVTAGRIASLETFCKSAPALMPVVMSFLPN